VQEHLIEMSIGETIQVGQFAVTLLDVNGGELCIEIDGGEGGDWSELEPTTEDTLVLVES
jgi:hypothetical protein